MISDADAVVHPRTVMVLDGWGRSTRACVGSSQGRSALPSHHIDDPNTRYFEPDVPVASNPRVFPFPPALWLRRNNQPTNRPTNHTASPETHHLDDATPANAAVVRSGRLERVAAPTVLSHAPIAGPVAAIPLAVRAGALLRPATGAPPEGPLVLWQGRRLPWHSPRVRHHGCGIAQCIATGWVEGAGDQREHLRQTDGNAPRTWETVARPATPLKARKLSTPQKERPIHSIITSLCCHVLVMVVA